MKHLLLWVSLMSVLLASSEFASSLCKLCDLFHASRDMLNKDGISLFLQATHHRNYVYYLEYTNGTRVKKSARIVYDDDQTTQRIFLHSVLLAIASMGFVWPCLLYIAQTKVSWLLSRESFAWEICNRRTTSEDVRALRLVDLLLTANTDRITLHNVHSLVEVIVNSIKCLVNLRCFKAHFNSRGDLFCYGMSLAKEAITPFTIYLSLVMLRRYHLLVAVKEGRRSCPTAQLTKSRNMLRGSSSDPIITDASHKRSSATLVLIASSMFGTLLADEPAAMASTHSLSPSMGVTRRSGDKEASLSKANSPVANGSNTPAHTGAA